MRHLVAAATLALAPAGLGCSSEQALPHAEGGSGGTGGNGEAGGNAGSGGGGGQGGGAPEPKELPAPATLGGERPAAVEVPASYDGVTPLPAVLLLGGYDYLSRDLDEWIGLSERVDDRNFVLVMPDGLIDEGGSPYWNATDTCCDYDGTGVDDAGYLTGLIEELTARVAIDPQRIAVVGHSAGGFMGYRLACEADSPVTALVSLAGSSWRQAADCDATHPVRLLQVHGQDDDIMPFDGDAEAPGALEVLGRWANRAGCEAESFAEERQRLELLDDDVDGDTVVSRYTTGCDEGIDVALWFLEGADHYPPFRPVFTDRVLDWLD